MAKLREMDLYRNYGRTKLTIREKLFMSPQLKYLKVLRACQETKGIAQLLNRKKLKKLEKITHIQIPWQTQIGGGITYFSSRQNYSKL